MKELSVSLKGIKKSYNKPVLTDINLEITNDSYFAIEGKSGSGKSTLMNILGLIENFDFGEYMFNGKRIKRGKDYSRIRLENIGFIFQSYNLISTMTSRVNRVELKNIIPPAAIQDAMEKQMKAERERREAILIAEAEKQSEILRAEK